MDGFILDRKVAAGESVTASLQPPTLFVIASDLGRMHVSMRIGEADIGGLKPGMPASIAAKAFPNLKFAGNVEQIRNVPETVDSAVVYEVLISVENKDLALRPGMSALVEIETGGI